VVGKGLITGDLEVNQSVIATSHVIAGGTIATSGYVGVGTTTPSPTYRLHVVGKGLITEDLQVTQHVIAGGTIATSGYVGVGTITPSPAYRLHVVGKALVTGDLEVSQSVIATAHVITGGTLATTNGNLGAGTQSPAHRLHVSGDGLVTGNVGIGVSPGADRLTVNGSTLLNGGTTIAGLANVQQLKTSGDHAKIENNGAAELTSLTVRPYSGTPGAAVMTVDGLGNLIATSLKGVQVDSTGNIRAEAAFYAGTGPTPRRVADSSGCYYA
jgi:hypothetical protein